MKNPDFKIKGVDNTLQLFCDSFQDAKINSVPDSTFQTITAAIPLIIFAEKSPLLAGLFRNKKENFDINSCINLCLVPDANCFKFHFNETPPVFNMTGLHNFAKITELEALLRELIRPCLQKIGDFYAHFNSLSKSEKNQLELLHKQAVGNRIPIKNLKKELTALEVESVKAALTLDNFGQDDDKQPHYRQDEFDEEDFDYDDDEESEADFYDSDDFDEECESPIAQGASPQFELDWDIFTFDGVSEIAQKFDSMVGQICIELKNQYEINPLYFTSLSSELNNNTIRQMADNSLCISYKTAQEFLSLMNEIYVQKSAEFANPKVRCAKIVAQAEVILLKTCTKSVSNWFNLLNIYNSDISLGRLRLLIIEFDDLVEFMDHNIMRISNFANSAHVNSRILLSQLKNSISELIEKLREFTHQEALAKQFNTAELYEKILARKASRIEIRSTLVQQLAKELCQSLTQNTFASLFILGFLKSDRGHYSAFSDETNADELHVCLGDLAIAAGVAQKIVLRQDF